MSLWRTCHHAISQLSHATVIAGVLGFSFASVSLAAEPSDVPILNVTPRGSALPAQSEILGHNIPANDWHGMVGSSAPFFLDPATGKFLDSWTPLTHAFPLRSVRYHCGNRYPWKDTVGPLAGRKRVEHDQWKAYYRTEAGLDEFLRWTESLPQPPAVTLVASPLRPVQEIADLVAYCNATSGSMAEWRAANGHPKPYNVRYWELGNEIDWNGRGDLNVMRADTPLEKRKSLEVSEYIRECKLRIAAMRQIDPSILIYAHAKTSPWSVTNPNWPEWHRAILREMGTDIDGIVIHPYYDGYPIPMVLKSVDTLIDDIHQLAPRGHRITVWVSEHSRWVNYENADQRPQSWGLQGAISAGDFLIALFERPDVSMANYWCYAHRGPWRVLNADWESGGQNKFGTGAYWLYLLMNRAYAPEVQPLSVDLTHWRKGPDDYAYPVRAMLFRDPATGRRAVVAINRSATQAFSLALAANLVESSPTTRLIVTGDLLTATNVPATPNAVTMTEDQNWGRRANGQQLLLNLPARSVTAWLWPKR